MAEKFCHIFTYKLDAFFIEKKILESVQQMLEAADERHRPSAPQKLSVSVKESYLLLSASAKTTIAQLAMACPFVPGRSIGTNFKSVVDSWPQSDSKAEIDDVINSNSGRL